MNTFGIVAISLLIGTILGCVAAWAARETAIQSELQEREIKRWVGRDFL